VEVPLFTTIHFAIEIGRGSKMSKDHTRYSRLLHDVKSWNVKWILFGSARTEWGHRVEEPEKVPDRSSPGSHTRGVLEPPGWTALSPLWRRAGAPMCSPAMPRSPISRLLSDWAGGRQPAPGTSSQDRSGLPVPRRSATRKVGRLSMGTDSSYSGLPAGSRSAASRRPACLSQSTLLGLQDSAHDPQGPVILLVDPGPFATEPPFAS
jgi:hypothetical protein